MTQQHTARQAAVTAITALAGLATVVAGVWALADTGSFAAFAGFDEHVHFLHDIGAFQLGLGAGLLLGLIWSDALATVLAAFLVGNTVHVVNHVVDLDHGGSLYQPWALGVLSVLVAVALGLRLRLLGLVPGVVGTATVAELAPFVRQKTISITTYRKDGRPGSSPVSIAVEGDHAFVRSFENSLKTKRLRRNPQVEIAPSNWSGKRITGQPVTARMRRLDGAEHRHAAAVLRRKYPVLHGVVVPLFHRVLRARTGRTVHFELRVD
ncbi:PPOX class F420-dependent enzyme [Prauserella muralis]|uniref:PPOX class F420-dependent enzyme n=2 Tax=Prauserella muralis TaxID=588067 RepID=A0A2V4B364_9PSEU|nr:PPOX class F420-dependent enzyme [Prauserella muralis]